MLVETRPPIHRVLLHLSTCAALFQGLALSRAHLPAATSLQVDPSPSPRGASLANARKQGSPCQIQGEGPIPAEELELHTVQCRSLTGTTERGPRSEVRAGSEALTDSPAVSCRRKRCTACIAVKSLGVTRPAGTRGQGGHRQACGGRDGAIEARPLLGEHRRAGCRKIGGIARNHGPRQRSFSRDESYRYSLISPLYAKPQPRTCQASSL